MRKLSYLFFETGQIQLVYHLAAVNCSMTFADVKYLHLITNN